MQIVQKLKYFIACYVGVLLFLLLTVTAIPLLVRHGFSVTRNFIVEEDVFESLLIVILFAISYLIWRGFKRTLTTYRHVAAREGQDKSRLLSRLGEAFSYIGTVNVEMKEIQSILRGVECYPQTKREFKELLEHLTGKVMTVAGTPWVVIRMISRCSLRTVKEYAREGRKGVLPSATLGNRDILEGRQAEGMRTISLNRTNFDLLTVCILPHTSLSEEDIILITAIVNQIEMLFMLHRSGCLRQTYFSRPRKKEISHAAHN